jgi:hypothetical protein
LIVVVPLLNRLATKMGKGNLIGAGNVEREVVLFLV